MQAVLNSSVDGGHIEEFILRPPCLKKGSLYHQTDGCLSPRQVWSEGKTTQYFP